MLTEEGLPLVRYGSSYHVNPVSAAQHGLAHLQHYWDTGQESYLASASRIAEGLARSGGEEELLWRSSVPYRGFTGWPSAMGQGQAASLLLRIGFLTEQERYLAKARKALHPFLRRIPDGGVQTLLNENVWFEEYAFSPPPYTLNGFIVSLFGLRDAALLLKEGIYLKLYKEGLDTLERTLTLFDVDGWSRYDLTKARLGPVPVNHLASPFYHRFHIELLRVLEHLVEKEEHPGARAIFEDKRKVWTRSLDRSTIFYRALLEKSLYRLAVQQVKAST
jgi:hypothetical protein